MNKEWLLGKVTPSENTKKSIKNGLKIVGIWAGYTALICAAVLVGGYAVDRGGEKLGLNKPIEFRQVK